MRFSIWPYWLRGALIPPSVVALVVIIAGISILIGFGFKLEVFSLVGLIGVYLLSGIAILVGAPVVEAGGFQGIEGGGSPTALSQVTALAIAVFAAGFVGWLYGKTRSKGVVDDDD